MRAHVQMMPVLKAEEALAATDQIAVGSGSLKTGVADQILERWKQEAERRTAEAEPGTARQASPEQLAAMGIGYRIVERAKA